MAAPVRIYLSFNVADAGVVEGLQKQLRAVFSGRGLELRDRSSLYAGAENALNGEAWLQWADLCIAVFSADYLGQDTSREWETAKRLERERRPALQILVAYARSAAIRVVRGGVVTTRTAVPIRVIQRSGVRARKPPTSATRSSDGTR